MVGGGGNPRIEYGEVDRSTSTADMLKADIRIEKEVAKKYDEASREVDDPGLKRFLPRKWERIGDILILFKAGQLGGIVSGKA